MDERAAAIILAGGSGTRFGGSVNKVFRDLDGRPVLRWSLDTLAPLVGHVVVVARPADQELLAPILAGHDVLVADGGTTRTGSERSGLEQLRALIAVGAIDVVAIHDGARPFVDGNVVLELIDTARRVGGAVPGWLVGDGTDVGDGSAAYELVGYGLVTVQTPQVFRATELIAAFDESPTADSPDTALIVRAHGRLEIALVRSDATNRKITFPGDLDS